MREEEDEEEEDTHPYPSWLRYCVSKVVSASTSTPG